MPTHRKLELGEIADVFVGVARHGRGLSWEENNPEAKLLGMKALRHEGLDLSAAETIHLAPHASLANYRIAAYDLLLPCRGMDFRIVLAPEEAAGMLIDSNIMALRCGPQLAPQLLVAYLQSPAGQTALLRASQSTTSQKNLTVRLAKKMTIPVPPLAVQQKAVALLEAATRQHQFALQVAAKRLTLAQHLAVKTMCEE